MLYNAYAGRRKVVVHGFVYVMSIFLSYFLLGLGILTFSISFPSVPHLLTKVSVVIMLFIGAINVLKYFKPNFTSFSLPMTIGRKAVSYMGVVTLPSLFASGFLVGVHNLPCACTGGIYPTYISLIAGKPFQMVYLATYNFMFVLPLVIILLICSNKAVTVRFRVWHAENTARIKLILGTLMILISLLIIFLIGFEIV